MHGHVCVVADTKEPCGFLPHSIDTQGRYSYNPRSACKSAAAKFGKSSLTRPVTPRNYDTERFFI